MKSFILDKSSAAVQEHCHRVWCIFNHVILSFRYPLIHPPVNVKLNVYNRALPPPPPRTHTQYRGCTPITCRGFYHSAVYYLSFEILIFNLVNILAQTMLKITKEEEK